MQGDDPRAARIVHYLAGEHASLLTEAHVSAVAAGIQKTIDAGCATRKIRSDMSLDKMSY